MTEDEFDVVLVGSGTCGATLARELSRRNMKVLLLEQGADSPLQDRLATTLAITREHAVGRALKAPAGVTVGGSTGLYFGVCKLPTAETFAGLGINLAAEVAETLQELPVAELPDEFLSAQSLLLRKSAGELGYTFKKNLMLIDPDKCPPGQYSHAAKWRAKSYVKEALEHGATLITRASAQRVIIEQGRAVGIEYRCRQPSHAARTRTVRGKNIVLSAGAFSTPKLLIDCGMNNIAGNGFFCKPAYVVCGTVPGLKAQEAFVGHQDIELPSGISLGDGAMDALLFRLLMLANWRWRYVFSHSKVLCLGILIYDALGGKIDSQGRYHKQLTAQELQKLRAAEVIAVRILHNAGAKSIFRTRLMAGIPGGVLRINEHFDQNLQTPIGNLYVCDHSLMSDVKITPTFTLVCLAKRLAKHLCAASQSPPLQPPAPAMPVHTH